MKKSYILIILVVILIILAIVLLILPKKQIIGGEREVHGCLIAAGYSWNETEQECIRQWISDYSRFQVTNFQQCEDASYPIQESYPRECRTPSGRFFTEDIKDGKAVCQKCGDRCILIESISALDCQDPIEDFSCEYLNGDCEKRTSEDCAKAGEEGDVHEKHCCSGLTAVPINKIPINGTCLDIYPPYGTQFYCINCGNNLCEEKENKCNCPEDC